MPDQHMELLKLNNTYSNHTQQFKVGHALHDLDDVFQEATYTPQVGRIARCVVCVLFCFVLLFYYYFFLVCMMNGVVVGAHVVTILMI